MLIPDEIAGLEEPTGIPVIEITRTAYTGGATVGDLNEMAMVANAYIREYDFDA
jgi:GntR family transcriptional regulator